MNDSIVMVFIGSISVVQFSGVVADSVSPAVTADSRARS
jgi:hypothetical protein